MYEITAVELTDQGMVVSNKPCTMEIIYMLLRVIFGVPDDIKKVLTEMYYYVLYIENEPIGLIAIQTLSENTMWVCNMGIREEYRRKGLGTMLFHIAKCFQQKTKMRMIFDAKDNEILNAFYRKMGASLLPFYEGENIVWHIPKPISEPSHEPSAANSSDSSDQQ